MRALLAAATTLLLAACASAPVQVPPSAAASAPAAPGIRGIFVEGPESGLDWARTLESFGGKPLDQETLAEIEATVLFAYEWAEWRDVQVIASPETDADGQLRITVQADAPLPGWSPPGIGLAMAEALAGTPPPPVIEHAGARLERKLDPALSHWRATASRVLIDAEERRLYFKRNESEVVSYPIAVGKARTPTPAGDFTVEAISHKPTWYPPASIRREYAARGKPLPTSVPPGKGNPLGDWFVRLQRGIGIHGTNQPRSIGRAASHGCIRMHDKDVQELARQLRAGDGVTVVRTRKTLGNTQVATDKERAG